jgi:iron complex outermembrane recepter protein
MGTNRCAALLGGALLALATTASGAQDARLSELSLEELSAVEIVSSSRRVERLSQAPTSVYVVTAADIRRSGVANLVEALRLAPNLQVARSHRSGYSVSARGFNGSSANKLLVLIDGRSVSSPLFSGVFWDAQSVMLEDVERIEVVSGPGGTLWGVNAVNGVINVVSRSSSETRSTLAVAGGGERASRIAVRHGATLGPALSYRLHAARTNHRRTERANGAPVDDAGHHTEAGFRIDGDLGAAGSFALHGATYAGRRGQPAPGMIVTGVPITLGPVSIGGTYVLGTWQRPLGGGRLQLQASFDRTERTIRPTLADEQTIADLQVQYTAPPVGIHQADFGAEIRRGRDRVDNSVYIALLPADRRQRWTSAYAQDEMRLADTLALVVGARAEHNDYTGTEFLPSLRLAWQAAPNQLAWLGVARTVRAPSRLDAETFVPGAPPFLLRGGPGVQSEVAHQVEIGYRGRPLPGTSLSAALYRARYDRLRSQEVDASRTFVYYANNIEGEMRGLELWGSLQMAPSWRLHAGFSRLLQDLRVKPGSNDTTTVPRTVGANPGRWWSLRSSLDIGAHAELDVSLRHVGAMALPAVPSYRALDLRWGWRPDARLEVSLSGRNLLGGGHGEFGDVTTRTHFQREWFANVEYRF